MTGGFNYFKKSSFINRPFLLACLGILFILAQTLFEIFDEDEEIGKYDARYYMFRGAHYSYLCKKYNPDDDQAYIECVSKSINTNLRPVPHITLKDLPHEYQH